MIIAAISLGLVVFVPALNQAIGQFSILAQLASAAGGSILAILCVAIFAGLCAIVVTIVFRLIYILLSRLF